MKYNFLHLLQYENPILSVKFESILDRPHIVEDDKKVEYSFDL